MKPTSVFVAVLVSSLTLVSATDDQLFPGAKHHKTASRIHRPHLQTKPVPAQPAQPAAAEVDAHEASPIAVPAAVDVGPEGFPQLPSVSTMLSTATDKMKDMTTQAGVLQASIARARQENEVKVAQQKHIYEKKLKVQEVRNKAEIANNANISDNIKKLQHENEALRNVTKQIRDTNLVMRKQLVALKGRLSVARTFVSDALTSTEDNKAEKASELQVLDNEKVVDSKTAPKKSVVKAKAETASNEESDDEDSDEDSDDEDSDEPDTAGNVSSSGPHPKRALSLLAVGRSVRHVSAEEEDATAEDDDDNSTKSASMSPNDLLAVLQKGIESITVEEKQSEANLKKMFMRDYKVGASRHSALLAQQRKLTATQASLVKLQKKLTGVKEHMQDVNGRLQQRLAGIGNFLHSLSHLAKAQPGDTLALLDALPTEVAIPNLGVH